MMLIKNLIFKFDRKFLFSKFLKLRIKSFHGRAFKKIIKNNPYKISIYYEKNSANEISILCDIYGSDKGEAAALSQPYPWPSHTYSDYYDMIFAGCRDKVTKVAEIGIGTNNPNLISSMHTLGRPGASLRVWRDYFPNANIVGGDIDADILFRESRISTYYINQLDPNSIYKFWLSTNEKDFDFILDDGLHTFMAGSTLFTNSIKYLSSTGVYVIEDVTFSDLLLYQVFFKTQAFNVQYIVLDRPGIEPSDNNLIVIRKLK